jgi:hypothetical protein
MGTFRKFLFILYSRRPRGRLLVNQVKIAIIDQKMLSYSPTVKEKIASGNGLGFQIQFEDLHLECCILREILKARVQEGSIGLTRNYP